MRKAVVIGASSGIGQGLARLLVKSGYKVGITGRRTNLLESLKEESPSQYIIKAFDITDIENVPKYLEELISKLGGLDLIVLSSGTGDLNDSLDFKTEKKTIDTNVSGFTCIVDWTYNYFQKQKFGHLVAISSISGLRGSNSGPSYNASKAYQINYLEGLRQKAVKQKLPIVITDIRPGFVNTAMAKGEGLFWVSPVDKATKQILNAIDKKGEIAYITKRWKLIAILLKLMPSFIYNRM